MFSSVGKRTPIAVRFSTVGELGGVGRCRHSLVPRLYPCVFVGARGEPGNEAIEQRCDLHVGRWSLPGCEKGEIKSPEYV